MSVASDRKRFKKWIKKNGGYVLPGFAREFLRFVARDKLCIVHERKGQIGAKVGPEIEDIWAAFQAGQPYDLSPEPVGRGAIELNGRRAVALAMADIRTGRSEPLSIRALCRSTGLTVRIAAKVARANGGRVCGMKLIRSNAR